MLSAVSVNFFSSSISCVIMKAIDFKTNDIAFLETLELSTTLIILSHFLGSFKASVTVSTSDGSFYSGISLMLYSRFLISSIIFILIGIFLIIARGLISSM